MHAGWALWFGALLGVCLCTTGCITQTYAVAPSAADMESATAATSVLQLTNPAENGEIEGYASAVSLNRGEDIKLYVNTKEPTYTIEILRIGWYGGRGSMSMGPQVTRNGSLAQAPPVMDTASGMIESRLAGPVLAPCPGAV